MNRTFILRNADVLRGLIAFLNANWKAMADQGKALAVSVTPHKAKRTLDQNARLHAVLTDIAANAWVDGRQYDMETWKEYYRRLFIGTEEIDMPNGQRIERGISTTTLDVAAFADFMTKIEDHAQDHLAVEFP